MTIDINQKEVKQIINRTGLTADEISKRISDGILMIEGTDLSIYPDIKDYYGEDFMGCTVGTFIDDTFDNAMLHLGSLAEKVAFGTETKANRIVISLASVVMMGEGDCPHCGSSKVETMDLIGRNIGDGYLTEPEFVGTAEMKCLHCNETFELHT